MSMYIIVRENENKNAANTLFYISIVVSLVNLIKGMLEIKVFLRHGDFWHQNLGEYRFLYKYPNKLEF